MGVLAISIQVKQVFMLNLPQHIKNATAAAKPTLLLIKPKSFLLRLHVLKFKRRRNLIKSTFKFVKRKPQLN